MVSEAVYESVRTITAEALEYAVTNGIDIGVEGIDALMKLLRAGIPDTQGITVRALGYAWANGGKMGKRVLGDLVKTLGDQELLWRARIYAAKALGYGLDQGGDIGEEEGTIRIDHGLVSAYFIVEICRPGKAPLNGP